MTKRGLLQEFRAITSIKRPAQRGYALERFMVDLFRAHHFQTTPNAGAAKPRQVDLFATRDAESYLIETKWRSDKLDISDIDGLRSRLRRVPAHVAGLLVSIEGFSESVIADVVANAAQPVILLSGGELERILLDRESLLRLLHRKKDALLTHGEVLLDAPLVQPKPARRKKSATALPVSPAEFVWPDGHRSRVLDCRGGFGQFVFTQEIPDIDWVPAAGVGVTLDLYPEIFSEQAILNLIDTLASLGWATGQARWSIQQSSQNWHGLGTDEFATVLPRWAERAESEDSHHSEELCYTDVCDGGFYTLTAKLAAHKSRLASIVNLSFQLQGIPLDLAPLMQLCKAIGLHEAVYFRPLEGRSITQSRSFSSGTHIDIREVAYIVQPDVFDLDFDLDDEDAEPIANIRVREWVTGIVIENPLCGDPELARSEVELELRPLESSELVICNLTHHHPLDYEPVIYRANRVECASSTSAQLYALSCDWEPVEPRSRVRDLIPGEPRDSGRHRPRPTAGL
ncbi:restriction endonuclease [Nonomuraea sp. NPDC049141]|uniref:restriction endonuclease n=1 Tax=unclassified Nonomuraea TaxID=2593643 RepID=UPI0033F72AB7